MVGKEPLWAAAARCHEAVSSAGIPHAIVGGVAVCLHGYRRTTVDVDILVASGASERIRGCLVAAGFAWDAARLHKAVRKTYRRLVRKG